MANSATVMACGPPPCRTRRARRGRRGSGSELPPYAPPPAVTAGDSPQTPPRGRPRGPTGLAVAGPARRPPRRPRAARGIGRGPPGYFSIAGSAIVRWPSVCATGRPSRPRAFGLSALFVPPLPLRHDRGHPAGEPCAFPAHKRLAHNNWTAYRCPCRWPAATRPDPTPPAGSSPSLRSPWLGRW